MKLTINRDTFLKAVTQCNIPLVNVGNKALACVALTATKDAKGGPDALALRSVNGLISMEPLVLCKVHEEGDCAVDFKKLRDAVSTMPAGDLSVELTKKGKLLVSLGKRRWTGDTISAKDIPPSADPKGGTMVLKIGARELLECVNRLEYVIDNVAKHETARQGVFLDVLDKQLTAVAIGEHFFALNKPAEARLGSDGKPFKLLLADYAMKQVREIAMEDEGAELELRVQEDAWSWVRNSSTLLCFVPPRGMYTDWRTFFGFLRPIPICRLPRLALVESLKAFISTSANPYHNATVTLFDDATLGIEPTEGDHFQDRIPVMDVVTKEFPKFKLQAQYFLSALRSAGADVVLSINENGQAITLATDDGFLAGITLSDPPQR